MIAESFHFESCWFWVGPDFNVWFRLGVQLFRLGVQLFRLGVQLFRLGFDLVSSCFELVSSWFRVGFELVSTSRERNNQPSLATSLLATKGVVKASERVLTLSWRQEEW